MFDQYQDTLKEKPDRWFYPSIIFAAATFIFITIFALNYSGLISIPDLFGGGMKVEGKAYVVTNGQTAVKLDSAKVCAISEEKIIVWIQTKNEKSQYESKKAKLKLDYAKYTRRVAARDYDKAQNSEARVAAESIQSVKSTQLSEAEADYFYWFSPEFYFNGLKDCDAQTETDSDGEFSLPLRHGKYALAVQSGRRSTTLKDDYYWLIWISPETSGKQVILNNDNLMTANPPEKVTEVKNP